MKKSKIKKKRIDEEYVGANWIHKQKITAESLAKEIGDVFFKHLSCYLLHIAEAILQLHILASS